MYIEETIQSVLLQRGKFYIDYVVIDNCSKDKTLEIVPLHLETAYKLMSWAS